MPRIDLYSMPSSNVWSFRITALMTGMKFIRLFIEPISMEKQTLYSVKGLSESIKAWVCWKSTPTYNKLVRKLIFVANLINYIRDIKL